MTDKIDSFRGEHFFLSNFYIEPDGTCVEMEFQASKCTNDTDIQFVMGSATPGEAKKRGRQVELRLDWEKIKVGQMLSLLRHKFSNPILGAMLLATGDTLLVEGNGWGDTFWGVCNGKGKNMLGVLLMVVRSELR